MKKRTGYVFERSGAWWARFRVDGTTLPLFRLKATDRAAAEIETEGISEMLASRSRITVADTLAASADRLRKNSEPSDLDIIRVFDLYRLHEHTRTTSARTMDTYESQWSIFKEWAKDAGIQRACDMTKARVVAFRDYIEGRGTTRATVQAYLNFLRMVWRRGLEGHTNPWSGVRPAKGGESVSHEPFTVDQLRTILHGHEAGEFRDLLWICCYTGLRLGDAAMLQPKQVSLSRRMIELYPRKTQRGRSPQRARIPIHDALAEVLLPRMGGECVLPSVAEQYAARQGALVEQFRRYLWKIGVDTRLERSFSSRRGCQYGFHSFRFTVQTLLAENGFYGPVADTIICHKAAGRDGLGAHYTRISDKVLIDAIHKSLPDLRQSGTVIGMEVAS